MQAVCAYRLFMPQAGITVSSREGAGVRDNLLQIAATKISAGVSTGIGTHSKQEREGDEQFEIDDNRSVDEVFNSIKKSRLTAGVYGWQLCIKILFALRTEK